MSTPHFFIDKTIPGNLGDHISIEMSKNIMVHLDTLRMSIGESLVLIDRPGHAYKLKLTMTPNKRKAVIEGLLMEELISERTTNLTLVQGISAADRMDQTIRQVTELGVSRIIPFENERSTIQLNNETREKKQSRWQRLAVSAAEQSAQLMYPTVEYPKRLAEVVDELSSYDLALFFWEESVRSLSWVLREHQGLFDNNLRHSGLKEARIAILIGSEGGFSQTEARCLIDNGAKEVSLGRTILRTETAAVVACALILYQLGALGGS